MDYKDLKYYLKNLLPRRTAQLIKNKLKRLEHFFHSEARGILCLRKYTFYFQRIITFIQKSKCSIMYIIGLVRNQKGTGAEINATRNCFWDSYWGRAGQLLVNFSPEVFANVNSAQFASRF